MLLLLCIFSFNTRRELAHQAEQQHIEQETFPEFAARVKHTIQSIHVDVIDRTIESLPRRMEMVVKSKGHRIKF